MQAIACTYIALAFQLSQNPARIEGLGFKLNCKRKERTKVVNMAFLSKVGKIFRQSSATGIGSHLQPSKLFIFQTVRFMSSSKVFVGGLSYGTDDQSLREAFTKYGEVVEARVILDRDTGRSRGFGFVTYTSNEEASSAIQALDGQDLHGRHIRVNFATERARGGFGRGGYGDGGNFGYGDGSYSSSSAPQVGRGGDNYFAGNSGSGYTANDQSGSLNDDGSGNRNQDDFLEGGKYRDEDDNNNDDYAKRA